MKPRMQEQNMVITQVCLGLSNLKFGRRQGRSAETAVIVLMTATNPKWKRSIARRKTHPKTEKMLLVNVEKVLFLTAKEGKEMHTYALEEAGVRIVQHRQQRDLKLTVCLCNQKCLGLHLLR